MTKRKSNKLTKQINDTVNNAVSTIYNLLKDNNLHLGDIKKLSIWKKPDDGTRAMPNSSMYMFIRLEEIEKLFHARCIHRDTEPLKQDKFITDAEIQAEYDNTVRKEKEREELMKTPEYQEYLRLKAKFETKQRPIIIVDQITR